MKNLSKLILVPNMEQNLSVRISTLLDIPADDFEIFRVAVAESWPFSNLLNFPRAFEKSFRGSSYVASYVNCGSDFPKFFEKYFKPKHSYSKGYGLGNPNFSLDSITHTFQ